MICRCGSATTNKALPVSRDRCCYSVYFLKLLVWTETLCELRSVRARRWQLLHVRPQLVADFHRRNTTQRYDTIARDAGCPSRRAMWRRNARNSSRSRIPRTVAKVEEQSGLAGRSRSNRWRVFVRRGSFYTRGFYCSDVKTVFLTKPVTVLWKPVFYRLPDEWRHMSRVRSVVWDVT